MKGHISETGGQEIRIKKIPECKILQTLSDVVQKLNLNSTKKKKNQEKQPAANRFNIMGPAKGAWKKDRRSK